MVYNQRIFPAFHVRDEEKTRESEKRGVFDLFLVSGFSGAAECRITTGTSAIPPVPVTDNYDVHRKTNRIITGIASGGMPG